MNFIFYIQVPCAECCMISAIVDFWYWILYLRYNSFDHISNQDFEDCWVLCKFIWGQCLEKLCQFIFHVSIIVLTLSDVLFFDSFYNGELYIFFF